MALGARKVPQHCSKEDEENAPRSMVWSNYHDRAAHSMLHLCVQEHEIMQRKQNDVAQVAKPFTDVSCLLL